MAPELGSSLPPGDPHALSVYIPTWSDAIAVQNRAPSVISRLKTGYPRFFMPLVVRELAEKLLNYADFQSSQKTPLGGSTVLIAAPGRSALLFPAEVFARDCADYLASHDKGNMSIFRVKFDGWVRIVPRALRARQECNHRNIFAVVYPEELAQEARAFWQHTGLGISSRFAEYWLENAPFLCDGAGKGDPLRELPPRFSAASRALHQRVAGLLSTEKNTVEGGEVFLYQSGMAAISHVASALKALRPKIFPGNDGEVVVVIFGFLYVDTFKLLGKVHGINCIMYEYSEPSHLTQLETDLARGLRIHAVFTEFTGNPLGASVDLDRLYQLAGTYGFMTIVDDTVGSPVNVSILSSCDIVCTSLSKMFSGACNVMGGSVVVNPESDYFGRLQDELTIQYPDAYFPLDYEVMESNSVDVQARVICASKNAARMADLLRQHSTVAKVFYPKGSSTQGIYEQYKRKGRGYGYLVTVQFAQPEVAIAFHNAFNVARGPSFGANFTLLTAHTLYSHYSELEWAAEHGVVEHLMRISAGIEEWDILEGLLQAALAVAKEVQQTTLARQVRNLRVDED